MNPGFKSLHRYILYVFKQFGHEYPKIHGIADNCNTLQKLQFQF